MAQGTTKGTPIDVDGTLAANSDLLVASQKATKTYVDTSGALKANINSPTFTGVPLSTTPTILDSSTKVATTAFVQSAIGVTGVPSGGTQTTTSTSAGAITGLSFAMEANSVYSIEGWLHIGCNNTGGVLFDVTLPTSATVWLSLDGRAASGTAYLNQPIVATATFVSTPFNNQNAQNGRVFFYGTVTTVGNTGNFVVRFASNTAGQTSTIYQEGSKFLVTRIS